jgi:hypothetical protein
MNELYKILELPNGTCKRCLDSGVWLTPLRKVDYCPNIQIGKTHNKSSEISLLFIVQAFKLSAEQTAITPQVFELGRILTQFSFENPCRPSKLFKFFFDDTQLTEFEKIKKLCAWMVELQKVFGLEITNNAHGYWLKGVKENV